MPATAGSTPGGEAPSRPPWWMFVIGAAFAGYFTLLLHSDLTRPAPVGFVSFGFDESGMILQALAPDSHAARAGLTVGDRVLAANGRAIRSRPDWLSVQANLRLDRPLDLEIARNEGSQDVALAMLRAPRSYWTTTPGLTLLVARGVQLATLLLAFVVVLRRPSDPSARVGAWLLATLAVYSIVWPYQIATTWRALPAIVGLALWIPFTSSLAVAAVILTFFATFPRAIIRSRRAWLAAWIPMAAVVFLELQAAAGVVYRPDHAGPLRDWTTIKVVVAGGYVAAALVLLVLGYRQLTDLTQRRRVRVLVVGSLVGLLSVLPVASSYAWRSGVSLGDSVFGSPVVTVAAILGLALPVSFAYAIVRHRLFDVRLIVRRGLQYALARRVLVSIVPCALALFLVDLWMNRQVPVADVLQARGWGYLALAGLAVVARVQRNRWLDGLDRRFFRERIDAQRVMRGIREEIRSATALEAVASSVVARIEAVLHPEFIALLVRRPPGFDFRAVAAAPVTTDLEPLSSESRAVGLLRWLQKPLDLPAHDHRAWPGRHLPREEVDALRRAGIELFVPVRLGAETTEALFALGPKRSEEPYSAEDEDLLTAVGESLALLLARDAEAPPRQREAFEDCPACGACYDFGTDRCPGDGAALAVTSAPRRLAGRYQLERRVGRGGMGAVYAAFDTALERHVAAKLLREDLVGGAGAAERFQSEARLAAALTHPNVVTVHDVGVTSSGRAFFIMELLEGATLREELRRAGGLAPARALHILRGVCAAVDAAHRRQMIHRDLKPENIVLCRSDASEIPKVLDFGLAKALAMSGSVALTNPGLVAGTPQYMAPEHLRGDEASPDWDLWALAVIAFEMITGALPPAGSAGVWERPDALSTGLQHLFARALSPNPIDRPTSARELLDELERGLVRDAAEPSRFVGQTFRPSER